MTVHRCDGCHISFELERVHHAPMLFDASWAELAKPNENLCLECFDARANERGIRITLADLTEAGGRREHRRPQRHLPALRLIQQWSTR